MSHKENISRKLDNALTQLRLRCSEDTYDAIMRTYGYVLGLRDAIIVVNKGNGELSHLYNQFATIERLELDNFAAKKLREIRAYKF